MRSALKVCGAVAVAAALFVLPAAAADVPAPTASYRALRVMNAGGMETTGTVYHDRGKERWEVAMSGMAQVRIMRPDLGKLITYMPQMNMAMEMALDGAMQFGPLADHSGPRPVAMGREDIAGESTTKYRTEVDSGPGAPFTVVSWVTDDGIVMRLEGSGREGRMVMYLKDLSRGPQEAALFEVPPGTQLMPANPAMLGPVK